MEATGSAAELETAASAAAPTGEIDWLWNTVTISGPAGAVGRFRAAARGTNAAPWYLDLDHEEARLLAPMASACIDARLLAREIRDVLARRHDRVRALWDGPGRCPFDLHRLVPIPSSILALGVDDPVALRWLQAHWGTTRPLRLVEVLASAEDKRLRRSARFAVRFQSADWTPWQAIARLRRDWPQLIFDVRPHYDRG